MHLKGWVKPLPDYIQEAVSQGRLTVHYDKKGDYEYLKGAVQNPHTGIVIQFL